MRHPFQSQPDLQVVPIEKIRLPIGNRDEPPPILAGLQWLWSHPTFNAEILALLEALRQQHSAVESEIKSLEHHGLNRCLDVGPAGYLRYAGRGVTSYHLHVIGRDLPARERARSEPMRPAA